MNAYRAHILGRNKRNELPKWVLFFDTETKDIDLGNGRKELILKLGYCELTRRNKSNVLYSIANRVFTTIDDFYLFIDKYCVGKERYLIVAHNVAFDVRVIGALEELSNRGWSRGKFILDGLNFILEYKRKGTTLLFLNNQQLFNYSLETLGKSVGLNKTRVQFDNVSDTDLADYCKNDVQIMIVAWNKLLQFIKQHDLGNFGLTTASQSFNAFRHKYMDGEIYIHHFREPVKIERASYHGGRTECFYIGKVKDEIIYYLDINSMYPFVMKDNIYPYRYLLTTKGNFSYMKYGEMKNHVCIAKVRVKISEPYLPLVKDNRLIFPIGTFDTTLAYPEFIYAYKKGDIQEIYECSWYLGKELFTSFVNDMYSLRLKYKSEGDTAFEMITKNILNSLYGKFGQRNTIYKKVGRTDKDYLGITYNEDLDTGEIMKLRIVDHIIEKEIGEVEGNNSFPAISSFVTSYARVHLWSLIDKAGIENLRYCDTDSLFVNEIGYQNLKSHINPNDLGMLKLVKQSNNVVIYGAKDYIFNDEKKIKGICNNADKISDNTYKQIRFEGMKGAIRRGAKKGIIIDSVVKKLHRKYLKGIVLPSGYVQPFELH